MRHRRSGVLGQRLARLRLRLAPGFDPADDLFVRHAGSAGPRFGQRRFDARHLPGVHFDKGRDRLAGEVGFAALGITFDLSKEVADSYES